MAFAAIAQRNCLSFSGPGLESRQGGSAPIQYGEEFGWLLIYSGNLGLKSQKRLANLTC